MTSTSTPARRVRRRLLASLLAAGAVAGPTLVATGGPAAAAPVPAPAPASALACHIVDFRYASVDPLVSPDPSTTLHRLTVVGTLPLPAKVTLEPLVYIRQPEHWGIQVMACPTWPGPIFPATNQPALMPPPLRFYKATLDFRGTMGSCGVEVIGANSSQTFDLAGPKGCGEIGPVA